ncbi:hypothetical protein ACFXKJ_32650 [Kitasatospora indigofera]|uniref:hypothetical protein n=1 Tax=Kitasatospora indigofera TaxID=67307 RepID=UPI0036BA21E0
MASANGGRHVKPTGRSRRTTALAGLTAAGTLTLALTACSDGGSASDTASNTASNTASSTAFTTPAAVPTAPASSDPDTRPAAKGAPSGEGTPIPPGRAADRQESPPGAVL